MSWTEVITLPERADGWKRIWKNELCTKPNSYLLLWIFFFFISLKEGVLGIWIFWFSYLNFAETLVCRKPPGCNQTQILKYKWHVLCLFPSSIADSSISAFIFNFLSSLLSHSWTSLIYTSQVWLPSQNVGSLLHLNFDSESKIFDLLPRNS